MHTIDYVSDILCVWAWAAEMKNAEVKKIWGEEVQLKPRFINLFGDTHSRIGLGWKDRGGFEAFAQHTQQVAEQFPELSLNKQVWSTVRPVSSIPAHLYLKAASLSGSSDKDVLLLAKKMRDAFFKHARDISKVKIIEEIIKDEGYQLSSLLMYIHSGEAYAALWADQLLRESQQLKGSPSYLLDGGRQVLFGNVGYRVIEANIKELVERDKSAGASWC